MPLSELEELCMLMVGILADEAYGKAIVKEIKQQTGRSVNLSTVHVTLYKLADKGFLSSEMGGITAERGGRRKRIYALSQAGRQALEMTRDEREKLWQLLPRFNFKLALGYA